MHEFSIVDGFLEINESLAEMIKYIANEPSVGLYYIQQHTQNAIPNAINLKNNVLEKSRETILHTEDLEDSISMVREMKECGPPIATEMIRDIENSLSIISRKQPKKGLITNTTSLWGMPSASFSDSDYTHDGESSSYVSSVFKSARQRASNLRWPLLDFKEPKSEPNKDKQLLVVSASSSSYARDLETDEQPVSSDIVDELEEDLSFSNGKQLLVNDNYDELQADREAKLKAWLAETDGNPDDGKVSNDAERTKE